MIEGFARPVDPDGQVTIEKLEPGIFLEVFSRETVPVEDASASCVCGSFHPESNPWASFYREAMDAGVIGSDGSIVWDDLTRFCAECGGEPESLRDLTLGDLANMLDNGETVLCQLNDFILADIRAESIPGLSGNTLLWVAGMDLSDPEDASVALGTVRGGTRIVPMRNFAKAWKASRNRAMVIQVR